MIRRWFLGPAIRAHIAEMVRLGFSQDQSDYQTEARLESGARYLRSAVVAEKDITALVAKPEAALPSSQREAP